MATKLSLVASLDIAQRKQLLQYAKGCAELNDGFLGDFRELLVYRDRAYQRQLNVTAEHIKAARANMRGDARKIPDLTVPIVMPQVESAVAYQTGVFLTDYPIFGVVAGPEQMTEALAFETALADQGIRNRWAQSLTKTFRRGFKYNFGPAVVLWQNHAIKKVVTNTATDTAGLARLESHKIGGNAIIDIDPYNCFMDTTVPPSQLHTDGEFFGWNTMMSRIQLMRMMRELDSDKTTQATEAYESQTPAVGAGSGVNSAMYYNVPQINQYLDLGQGRANIHGETNWAAFMGLESARTSKINYKGQYLVTHFLCRARPSDFGRNGNTPVVYHAIIVNWSVVLFVEELNVGHDYLPAFVCQPYDDGLGYQTQSMIDNALPYQDMSSALWNISLESKRRLVFDRLVYNPRLIDKKDIDPASSVARIPLRNVNIGKDDNSLQRALYQIPFRDVDSSALQMSDMISQMSDQASGQNRVDRGQFQKGNKTAAEFQTVMGNSNSRQQLSALAIENQFMTPVKEALKSNTLQYQTAGKLMSHSERRPIDIDPIKLREAMLEFKMTDGMLSTDKLMSPQLLQVFMQTAQAIPGVATEYDVMGMFLYWAKLQGAHWLDDFRRDQDQQAQFLQTLQATTQAQGQAPAGPPAAASGPAQ